MRGRLIRAWRWPAVVALAAVVILSLGFYDELEREAKGQERLYFPSGRFLREAACGFREVAADYLWFQAVQYYGGFRKGENDFRYFDQLIDSIVALDPRFVGAYYFSALAYSLDFGDIEHAVGVLKRGIIANPDVASLPFHVGFMYYVFAKDYPRASVWFEHAARRPDASDFHQRFAAFARKRAGQLEAALVLWRHIHDTASNPELKAAAAAHVADCERLIAARDCLPLEAGS